MLKINLRSICFLVFLSCSLIYAQDIMRKVVEVPKVDSGAITIDGNMDETAWQGAAHADLVTNSGYNIWFNPYDRDLSEPDYVEHYGRMLWSKDTLYLFIHIQDVVNDSSGLFWAGQWIGDQLFVGLSDRLGTDMTGNYDGNVYTAPDGPYHFLIMADSVTLNATQPTYIPDEFRKCDSDSQMVFHASDYSRWAIKIDTTTGTWDIEMAIYNPGINADAKVGFNIGGSQGSRQHDPAAGDAYAYYCWQPNIQNQPLSNPTGENDPGYYMLVTSKYWADLHFMPGQDDISRFSVNVPKVDSGAITIDGKMDESAWQKAGHADLVTNSGYNIWFNPYDRNLTEPDYVEHYSRMLWSKDTLYLFIHIQDVVNDSSGLFWAGQWIGDQLFVGLSNRLGMDMKGWYDGNVYAAPDGPYHYLIMADSVTLNATKMTNIPEEFQDCSGDTARIYYANDYERSAITIDTTTGEWNIEMAIYNPGINLGSSIGFNIGGSQGSRQHDPSAGDAYAYYTWQPNVQNDPFANPTGENDPGYYILVTSEYWALLNFTTGVTGIHDVNTISSKPTNFQLEQNYPNPFNPSTAIRFDLPVRSNVTLKIYNAVGQLVTTLLSNQSLTAGIHSVNWDAAGFASGVYFYSINAGDFISTKKMILLK